jgi:uncharacterized protein YqjF (DUF2071 family)
MPRIFLRAEWRNLIIVSYHVPAGLLERYLPRGLELDLFDGKPAVSLVAFEFRNTRVWGVPWPGFVNFPEWNLRFYVKTTEPTPRRGVVFVREFVPSRIVSLMARCLYNEPYTAASIRFGVVPFGDLVMPVCMVCVDRTGHTLHATASTALRTPHDSTTEHLLKEHQWGFGRTRAGKTLCYEVVHPTWRIHEDASVDVDVDWARLYGPEWGVMQEAKPFSTILAEGSAITVSTATTL